MPSSKISHISLDSNINVVLGELTKKIENKKVVVLAIGNILRGDDGFGDNLAKRIHNKVSIRVYDAGTAPENFIGKIIKEKPEVLLLVDAVDFGANPGQLKLWPLEDVKSKNFSLTHNPSPSMLFNFLKEDLKCNFYMLGIQPKNIAFGQGMSPELKKVLIELTRWFKNTFPLEKEEDKQ